MPVFARDVLQTGPWGLGLLRAAPAMGALASSLVLARLPLTLPIGKVLFGVVLVFGGATVVFALSNHLLLSLAALAVLGAADAAAGDRVHGHLGEARPAIVVIAHLYKPLVSQIRLDGRLTAVGVGQFDFAVLDVAN